MKKSDLIIVRGAGDLATGTIHRLKRSGCRLLVLETNQPAAIRRQVAFSEAVYSGSACVEGVEAIRVENEQQMRKAWENDKVPVLVDPEGKCIASLQPKVVVDAILAKRNLGTNRKMAPLTIALGPGFLAGEDVDVVIETKRGHNLGRVIRKGSAYPNTGIPGIIGGYGAERVIHAPAAGILKNKSKIGDIVEKGQVIAIIEEPNDVEENEKTQYKKTQCEKTQCESKETKETRVTGENGKIKRIEVTATLSGLLRGLIRDNYPVTKGFKIADIDPRKEELANCFTISDKARCIAGSVLEVICETLE